MDLNTNSPNYRMEPFMWIAMKHIKLEKMGMRASLPESRFEIMTNFA